MNHSRCQMGLIRVQPAPILKDLDPLQLRQHQGLIRHRVMMRDPPVLLQLLKMGWEA